LWRASQAAGGDASSGATFGVLFIGGGIYAAWHLANDWRDLIVELDRGTDGSLTASRWTPFGPRAITGGFGNWRFYVKLVGRSRREFFLYVDHPSAPRPLKIELRPGMDLSGLRQVAPEAIAEYEQAAGKA
jgi:hypothetical protein